MSVASITLIGPRGQQAIAAAAKEHGINLHGKLNPEQVKIIQEAAIMSGDFRLQNMRPPATAHN